MDPPRGNEAARLAPTGAWPIYRRLLGYLRPHRVMFLFGVLGMIMFAATDAGWAAFVRFFLDGTFVDRATCVCRSRSSTARHPAPCCRG
jgi:subfamily B ATP-binding cassette protein MsbA